MNITSTYYYYLTWRSEQKGWLLGRLSVDAPVCHAHYESAELRAGCPDQQILDCRRPKLAQWGQEQLRRTAYIRQHTYIHTYI